MKKNISFLFVFILFLTCFNLFVFAEDGKTAEQELIEKQNELVYVKSQIKQNQYAIDSINKKSDSLSRDIFQIDLLVNETNEEISSLENNIKNKNLNIDSLNYLKNINNQNNEDIKNNYELFFNEKENYLNWAYSSDTSLTISLRLNQYTMSQTLYFKSIEKNLNDNKSIKSKEKTVLLEKEQLEETRRIIETKKKFIDEQYNKKMTLLDSLNEQKDQYSSQLMDLEYISNQVASSIKDIQKLAIYQSSIKQGKGVMSWPTTGGKITSPYGLRIHPIKKVEKFHTGIDIGSLGYGKPVLASADGIVVYSGWISGYGNTIIIDHGNNVSTLYAHNQKLTVEVGQKIQRGFKVAEVGSTGLSTGPHIHFEVRINGTPVNPEEWL